MTFLAITIGLAVAYGLLRGGRLSRLAALPIKYEWIFIAALGVRLFVLILGRQGVILPSAVVAIIHAISYSLLLVGTWLNRDIRGMPLIGIGSLLNGIVIVANGGRMPVSYEAALRSGKAATFHTLHESASYLHQTLTPSTRLAFLGDVLSLPEWAPVNAAFSVGDVFILLGIFIMIQRRMLTPLVHEKPLSL